MAVEWPVLGGLHRIHAQEVGTNSYRLPAIFADLFSRIHRCLLPCGMRQGITGSSNFPAAQGPSFKGTAQYVPFLTSGGSPKDDAMYIYGCDSRGACIAIGRRMQAQLRQTLHKRIALTPVAGKVSCSLRSIALATWKASPHEPGAAASYMQLVIQAHEGTEQKTIKLDVQSSDSIDSVKKKIQEQAGAALPGPLAINSGLL